MRACLPLAVCLLAACDPDCGPGTQVDGDYAVFANIWESDGTNLDEFPSYMSPANGWSEWSIDWAAASGGAVVVTIDEQPFSAQGSWNEVECGNFDLTFDGSYRSTRDTLHEFSAVGHFVAYASRIEGVWDWEEDWTSTTGETGRFSATGQLSGTEIDRP